ncbi:MAG: HIT family protein [Nanoarchaeota archaeon]
MKNCLFCNVANNKEKSFGVYEDKFIKAFLDINPASEGHTLVIPKKHYKDIFEVDPKILSNLILVVKKLSLKYKEILNVEGVNIISSSGKAAQQDVLHLHFHIIPRKSSDKIDFKYETLKEVTTRLPETAKMIREALKES